VQWNSGSNYIIRTESKVKIQEHHARDIFKRFGIPVPDAVIATTPEEVKAFAEELGKPVVIKAQVLVGGRGKAGGVKLADNPDDAYEKASQILGMDLKGLTVEKVLVAPAVDIESEYYIGVTMDRDKKHHVVIASSAGGVDIEQVAEETPEKIGRLWVDPAYGLHQFELRKMLFSCGFEPKVALKAAGILMRLYKAVIQMDMSLVEINPLVKTTDGEVLAIDAKINFDDSGLFRHPELKELKESEDTDPIEKDAHARGLTYVRLEDGNVGVIGNGAGLVMATMDEVKRVGKGIAKPANFLDIGGGAQADVVKNALEVVLSDPNAKSILINVFGGITRCDEVAKGLLQAIEGVDLTVPVVIRLAGTNWEEGKRILEDSPLYPVESLEEGANKITEWMESKV
jgi:succinyl-CoA synthetase beta subunit